MGSELVGTYRTCITRAPDGAPVERSVAGMRAAGRFPLTMARDGERVRIVALHAGRGLDRRLAAMGLAVGMEVRVMQSQTEGPLLVAVRDTRLGLGRGMAHKILVVPIEGAGE